MTTTADPRPGAIHTRLAAVVAATLRVPLRSVRLHDSFAALGMDSLVALELTAAIEDELGIELPMTAVHEYADLDSLCRFIEEGAGEEPRSRLLDRMLADAELPAEIRPHGEPVRPTCDARAVLLTGATGFVGAHLLHRLIGATSATVWCLVRPSAMDARQRLRVHLSRYGLWSDVVNDRVRIVHGDLARPRFGLDSPEWDRLAGGVDVIYHAAADVNWVYGYDALRAANVIGTREVLRLACAGTPKPLHFLSSVSVCHSTTGPRVADEQVNPLATVEGLRLGYAQSKCVAESLVRQAGGRGLPVTIIRPSLVTGDRIHGRSNVDDLVSRFVAGCIRMHAAPDLDWRLDCVPVDEVVDAVVRLSRSHATGIATWHITAERPRHWRECVLWMRLCGYEVDLLPYREWMNLLSATDDIRHPLHSLRSFFLHGVAAEGHLTLPELFEESRRAHVSAMHTRRSLDALGHRPLPIDSKLLSRYFDHFVEQGVVPAARGRQMSVASVDQPPDLRTHAMQLQRSLRTWTGDDTFTIRTIDVAALAADNSIVAELTAWRAGTCAGLYRACVTATDRGGDRVINLFVKSKPADEQVIEVAESVAALASPSLAAMVRRFRNHLGFTNCHLRELALYSHRDPRLRDHSPRVMAIHRDDAAREWMLVLESIDDAALMNASDNTSVWNDAAIDAALVGLARIHAVWFDRTNDLMREPWIAPPRDCRQRRGMTPLWTALAEHASEHSAAWQDPSLCRLHDRLATDVTSWAAMLDRSPRALIHNDFNPRNIAIRRGENGLSLCAYDWELASIGVPQRDVAELFAFVLPPDAPGGTIAHWLERHRTLLERECGVSIDRVGWKSGFSAALCDLLVDRLASYAMVDRVRPQEFLPRVVRSWSNLYRYYPWTD